MIKSVSQLNKDRSESKTPRARIAKITAFSKNTESFVQEMDSILDTVYAKFSTAKHLSDAEIKKYSSSIDDSLKLIAVASSKVPTALKLSTTLEANNDTIEAQVEDLASLQAKATILKATLEGSILSEEESEEEFLELDENGFVVEEEEDVVENLPEDAFDVESEGDEDELVDDEIEAQEVPEFEEEEGDEIEATVAVEGIDPGEGTTIAEEEAVEASEGIEPGEGTTIAEEIEADDEIEQDFDEQFDVESEDEGDDLDVLDEIDVELEEDEFVEDLESDDFDAPLEEELDLEGTAMDEILAHDILSDDHFPVEDVATKTKATKKSLKQASATKSTKATLNDIFGQIVADQMSI